MAWKHKGKIIVFVLPILVLVTYPIYFEYGLSFYGSFKNVNDFPRIINDNMNSILKFNLNIVPLAEAENNASKINTDNSISFDSGIPVRGIPFELGLNPNNNILYVADKFSKKITFIDEIKDIPLKNVSLGDMAPSSDIRKGIDLRSILSLDNSSNLLYTATTDLNQVSVIDGIDGTPVTKYEVNGSPFDIVSNNQKIFIIANTRDSDSFNGTIYSINGFFNRIDSNYTLSQKFFVAVDVNPKTDKAYVLSLDGDVYVNEGSFMDFRLQKKHSLHLNQAVDLAINPKNDVLYIADRDSSFIYTINETSSLIDKIPISSSSTSISINPKTNMIYATNPDINKVSVINGTTNKLVNEITVGNNPRNVVVNTKTDTVYVSNMLSHSISIINGSSGNLMGGINFRVNPSDSGVIVCNGVQNGNNYIRYDVGTSITCTAKTNNGYLFSSWSSDLVLNSIKVIPTVFDYVYSTLYPDSNNVIANNISNINKTPFANVTVSKIGTLTASFVSQSPISAEFWVPLYGLIPGFFIPSLISWAIGKRQRKHFGSCRKDIDNLISKYKENCETHQQYLQNLNRSKEKITEAFEKGKINESQFNILINRIKENG